MRILMNQVVFLFFLTLAGLYAKESVIKKNLNEVYNDQNSSLISNLIENSENSLNENLPIDKSILSNMIPHDLDQFPSTNLPSTISYPLSTLQTNSFETNLFSTSQKVLPSSTVNNLLPTTKSIVSSQTWQPVTSTISSVPSSNLKVTCSILQNTSSTTQTTIIKSNSQTTKSQTSSSTQAPYSLFSFITPKKPNQILKNDNLYKEGKCICYAENTFIVRYKLLSTELDLGEAGNLGCSQPLKSNYDCLNLCKDNAILKLGKDIDLSKTVKTKKEKISFGRELCRQAGQILIPSTLRIKSYIFCSNLKNSIHRDTGLRSKQKFICILSGYLPLKTLI